MLCIAGSQTPQTREQVSSSVSLGAGEIELDTINLFDSAKEYGVINGIISVYEKLYKDHEMVIIHVPFDCKKVLESKRKALESGVSEQVSAKKVSRTLAWIAKRIYESYPLDGVIVCGGDTSSSFINEFNIRGMMVGPEIESGVSICSDIFSDNFNFVLKSGSFGSSSFLEKAGAMLEDCGV